MASLGQTHLYTPILRMKALNVLITVYAIEIQENVNVSINSQDPLVKEVIYCTCENFVALNHSLFIHS